MRRETWVALWVAGAVTCGWGQGALTPSGAPGATMKTLLQMAPEVWEPAACPLCAQKQPFVHPGS